MSPQGVFEGHRPARPAADLRARVLAAARVAGADRERFESVLARTWSRALVGALAVVLLAHLLVSWAAADAAAELEQTFARPNSSAASVWSEPEPLP